MPSRLECGALSLLCSFMIMNRCSSVVVLAVVHLMGVTLSARPGPLTGLETFSRAGTIMLRPFEAFYKNPFSYNSITMGDIATVSGVLGTAVGIFPSIPQLIENYRSKSGEALSMDMFVLRGAADLVNLFGSFLCHEPVYIVTLNTWYIIDTIIFTSQSAYYTFWYHRKTLTLDRTSTPVSTKTFLIVAFMIAVPVLMFALGRTSFADVVSESTLMDDIGTFCLWASNLLFVSSRIPQLYKIWRRKSVEGISMIMYLLTMSSNMLSGTGVLLQNIQDQVPISKMIVGSSAAIFMGTFGSIFFDLIFLYLVVLFRQPKTEPVPEGDPNDDYFLLMDDLKGESVLEIPSPAAPEDSSSPLLKSTSSVNQLD